jgi:molybdopterin synthase catalytic subunit
MKAAIVTELTENPIDIPYWMAEMNDAACGASLVFAGIVRDHNHGKSVVSVSYDAFVPLCRKVFAEICGEARETIDPLARIALIHRLGKLKVGEASVLIVVTTPHRDEAYRTSRHVIEKLKTRAPIWKKETYDHGESEWLQGHALCSPPSTREGQL